MNELQFILYNTPEGNQRVQVVVRDETLWCTQKAMAQLFGVGVPAISKHLNHIFEEGELSADTTVSKMEIVVNRGYRGEVTEDVAFYSLDAIIAVGYRVSSLKATRFRQWATKILNEYIKKGFVMDDERLKQGKTAPEIIYTSADHTKEHMGLQTWKHAPDGRILPSDTKVAKNYLSEKEIRQLERAVTGYFDYVEDLVERENAFNMQQFAASINGFLTFRRYALLPDKGSISREEADCKAEAEYKAYILLTHRDERTLLFKTHGKPKMQNEKPQNALGR